MLMTPDMYNRIQFNGKSYFTGNIFPKSDKIQYCKEGCLDGDKINVFYLHNMEYRNCNLEDIDFSFNTFQYISPRF